MTIEELDAALAAKAKELGCEKTAEWDIQHRAKRYRETLESDISCTITFWPFTKWNCIPIQGKHSTLQAAFDAMKWPARQQVATA